MERPGRGGALALYARALAASLGKRQGKPCRPAEVGEVRRGNVVLEPEKVGLFRRVCGYGSEHGPVAPVYPETLFLDLMARLVTSRAFPLSAFGLIHVGQTIRRTGLLEPGDIVDLSCAPTRIEPTASGCEVEFDMRVRRDGAIPWRGAATLLSRGARRRKRRRGGSEPPADVSRTADVPARVGRSYARVSGDWSPQHVSLTAARVMGFRRPIAHGMWTLSRVLAWIDEGSGLDEDVEITCVFKKPVLIPGRIELTSRLDGSTRHVSVLDPSSGAPHLTASVVSRTASSRG